MKLRRYKTRFDRGLLLLLGIFLFVLGIAYYVLHSFTPSTSVSQKNILYWIDAMEPQIHYDHPGKSRMNMELVPIYEETEKNKGKNEQPLITISPGVINSLGVRTALVEEAPLMPLVQAFGMIKADEDKVVHIHSYVEGWIQKLYAKELQELIEKDQPLFEIYSKDLRLAQREYLIASKGNAQKDEENTLGKLRSLGISEKQIEDLKKTKQLNSWVTIYAPRRGYVDTLNVREGMWVKPETTIMSLTDLSEVWVIAEIFPSQIYLVKVGQSAKISLPQFPNQSWQGKVDYIYPEIDPISLTIKVRIRLSNASFLFKPNMFVDVEIQTPSKRVLQIPREAVIWEEGGQRVILALDNGKFQPQAVITGMEDSKHIEIVSGLRTGERVVTSAQFLLDSEVEMKSALQRLESPSSSPDAPMDHSSMAGHGS